MHYILQFLLFLAISTASSAQQNYFTSKSLLGKVVKVIDGDTVDFLVKDSMLRLRLFGIDAPEKGQDYYSESKYSLEVLVLNKEVYVEVKEKDRYGRSVAIIYRNSDKMNINYEMVKKGMAWHFIRYSADPELAKFEIIAREKELGLWSKYYYLEPWEFRKSHNKKQQAD